MNTITTIGIFYCPAAVGAFLFVLIFMATTVSSEATTLVAFNFGFIIFSLPIKNLFLPRLVLFVFGIMSFSAYGFMDYSIFFPKYYESQIFYSVEKLNKSLATFTESELKSNNIIIKDWETNKDYYYKQIEDKLKKVVGKEIGGFFSSGIDSARSDASGNLLIKKMSPLNYYISEGKGIVNHKFESNNKIYEWRTGYIKATTVNDYIRPSLSEIFHGEFIIMPVFQMSFYETFTEKPLVFDHTLYALTKVYLFPWPQFSDTIYLFHVPNIGLVPIGLGVYKNFYY